MAEYILMKRPDLNGDGKRPIYPKMKIRRTVETADLAEIIARRSTFSSGEVKGLISLLSDTMAECMAKGESVRVAGVGLFTASLGLLDGVERAEEGGPQHNARNIRVRSVNYRPDSVLVEKTNSRCELKRGHMPVRALLIEKREDRLAAAVSHIAEKGFLRVSDYVKMTGLEPTAAGVELRAFANEGHIGVMGRKSHTLYVKASE